MKTQWITLPNDGIPRGGEGHTVRHYLTQDPFYAPLLSIHMLFLSYITVSGRYFYKAHRHQFGEFIFPTGEKYQCLLNDEEIAVVPGQGLFIAPGDWHEDRVERDARFLVVVFSVRNNASQRDIGQLLNSRLPAEKRIFAVEEEFDLDGLARRISDEGGDEAFRRHELSALGSALVWRVFMALSERLSGELLSLVRDNAFYQEVNNLFMAHMGSAWGTTEMAKALRISKRALEYKFKTLFGHSPAKAFLNYRIRQAEQLLAGGMRAKEVAYALGFANPHHFSRAFRKHAGITVSAYIRATKDKNEKR